MIFNLKKNQNKNIKTDILIIGGGTIGLFLAERLKAKFKEITILEKGSETASNKFNSFHKNNSLNHEGFTKNISIGLGGNSTLWGGQLVEFDKGDFNKNYNWGLTYIELKKFYKKIYKIFNINIIKEKDFLNHTKQSRAKSKNLISFFTHWLNQPNFKKFYEKNIQNSKYKIILNSNILKFNFKNKKCEFVEFEASNRKNKIYPKIIVLCCGTFNNTKIMLNHQSESPWKNNKFVGKYFQDHIGLHIGKLKIFNKKKFNDIFTNGFVSRSKYQPKIKSRYTINNFEYGISGEIKNPKNNQKNLSNKIIKDFILEKSLKNLLNVIKVINFKNFFLIKKIFYFIIRKKIIFNDLKKLSFYVQCEQKPLKNSFINLISKKKKIYSLNWKICGDEFKVINKFVKDVNLFLKREKIGEIDLNYFSKLNLKLFKEKLRDTNHPSGGIIMSKNLNYGVLDKNQRVQNTKNFYVAGSSTFPKSSHANVTLTSLALTERLACHLIKKN